VLLLDLTNVLEFLGFKGQSFISPMQGQSRRAFIYAAQNPDITGALPFPLPHLPMVFQDSGLLRRAKHPCKGGLLSTGSFWAALPLRQRRDRMTHMGHFAIISSD
jgi:hypothetical protein